MQDIKIYFFFIPLLVEYLFCSASNQTIPLESYYHRIQHRHLDCRSPNDFFLKCQKIWTRICVKFHKLKLFILTIKISIVLVIFVTIFIFTNQSSLFETIISSEIQNKRENISKFYGKQYSVSDSFIFKFTCKDDKEFL